MTQVSVTIAGRSYRMACAEGEEQHLESLALAYDEQIGEMRKNFGEIGDMRLHVMAALTFADQISELRAAQSRYPADNGGGADRKALGAAVVEAEINACGSW